MDKFSISFTMGISSHNFAAVVSSLEVPSLWSFITFSSKKFGVKYVLFLNFNGTEWYIFSSNNAPEACLSYNI
jgi:hypothetical protein